MYPGARITERSLRRADRAEGEVLIGTIEGGCAP